MRRYILNSPAVEPLSLPEIKRWLRVDHSDDDGLILGLIKAARERIEARTGRALMAQSWRIILDRWPGDGRILLPLMPVLSVPAVQISDTAGVLLPLAPTTYRLEPGSEPPLLAVTGVPQPGRDRNGIEIDVVAGYGLSGEDCPEALRQAMRLLVSEAYERRGPDQAENRRAPIAVEIEALISPYRSIRLGKSALEQAA
ncbi:MAG: head-tail connector protein [Beijerinckiaceae bacterium]